MCFVCFGRPTALSASGSRVTLVGSPNGSHVVMQSCIMPRVVAYLIRCYVLIIVGCAWELGQGRKVCSGKKRNASDAAKRVFCSMRATLQSSSTQRRRRVIRRS